MKYKETNIAKQYMGTFKGVEDMNNGEAFRFAYDRLKAEWLDKADYEEIDNLSDDTIEALWDILGDFAVKKLVF